MLPDWYVRSVVDRLTFRCGLREQEVPAVENAKRNVLQRYLVIDVEGDLCVTAGLAHETLQLRECGNAIAPQIDLVPARTTGDKISDYVVAITLGEYKQVVASLTHEKIITGSTDQRVIAIAAAKDIETTFAIEHVAPIAAGELIIAVAAKQPVVANIAKQHIGPAIAGQCHTRRHIDRTDLNIRRQRIIADMHVDPIRPRTGILADPVAHIVDYIGIVPGAPAHDVGPCAAVQIIVAITAAKLIEPVAAKQPVVANIAKQHIGPAIAGQCHTRRHIDRADLDIRRQRIIADMHVDPIRPRAGILADPVAHIVDYIGIVPGAPRP